MAVVGDLVIGRKSGIRLPVSGNASALVDFRTAMPAGSTYTRASAAMALTVAGVIQSCSVDAPQRTDRGLALEPAATNLLVRSQEFDNASWAKTNATVTANVAVAPDGTTTADLVIPSVANAQHRADQTPVSSAGDQIYSVFGSPGGYGFALLRIGLVGINISFNLTTGAITGTEAGASPSVLAVAAGFYRTALAVTGVAANAIARTNVSATGADAFAGDGVSGVNFWQAQLEAGSVATSPIVTTAAQATRALPVFTETVPTGNTKALLTYYDGTTTLVTGLPPGGTFDVATAVIGAGKGRFGVSELVTRLWLS